MIVKSAIAFPAKSATTFYKEQRRMEKNLYNKIRQEHAVGTLADGRPQLFIGTHLIHEVTIPQAFGIGTTQMLDARATQTIALEKLKGDQLYASFSRRNFKGRQGSPTGRTISMRPFMVATAAVSGKIEITREVFSVN